MITITKEDLWPVVESHTGNRVFQKMLRLITAPHLLVRAIGQYIMFNSVFGGGVANLAGEIAERKDIFWDGEEPVTSLADRSVLVSAPIYAASIEEFGGGDSGFTHRALAQATLKGMGQFFSLEPGAINDALITTPGLTDAMGMVQYGYGLNRELGELDLFRGMGFHMGSECLADQEFNILDNVLVEHWPDLVRYLNTTNIAVGGVKSHPAYEWVEIHTTVEADHFAFATQGANLALQYYHGEHSEGEVMKAIILGFVDFARVQLRFMEFLAGRD